ncbi:MAG: ABC transporter ATP-binding protein [Desulfobacteraceae bacterium]|nr:MAG: ABC transporter ATP-binding protein [Desulfobacteraceae bacterium]
MLELRNVSIDYADLRAVRDLSILVREKEAVALIGPNGAGKTTTLRGIMGLVPPAIGQVLFLGEMINGSPPFRIVKRGISLVPEGRRIFPRMTVRENIELGAYPLGKKGNPLKSREEVYRLFPVLGKRALQPAGTLSGGEQQMLAIGRALMAKPRLLMLDEPSLGLAPVMIEHLYRSIQTLKREGLTILLVEQYVSGALELTDRAYVIETGGMTKEGYSQELLTDPEIQKSYLALDSEKGGPP